MTICYCTRCYPQKLRTERTKQLHLSDDQILLRSVEHTILMFDHIQHCIRLNEEGIQPEPEGEI